MNLAIMISQEIQIRKVNFCLDFGDEELSLFTIFIFGLNLSKTYTAQQLNSQDNGPNINGVNKENVFLCINNEN